MQHQRRGQRDLTRPTRPSPHGFHSQELEILSELRFDHITRARSHHPFLWDHRPRDTSSAEIFAKNSAAGHASPGQGKETILAHGSFETVRRAQTKNRGQSRQTLKPIPWNLPPMSLARERLIFEPARLILPLHALANELAQWPASAVKIISMIRPRPGSRLLALFLMRSGNSIDESALQRTREIVLIGGGHAHIQVIRRWMMRPVPNARLTVVADQSEAVYSGMLPGVIAGEYAVEDALIDLRPLSHRAGARYFLGRAERVDTTTKQITIAGRAPVAYDWASLDIGSTIRGIEDPGFQQHAIATRPIGRFIPALEAKMESLNHDSEPISVIVVGGGAAGLELALCLDARFQALSRAAKITVLNQSTGLLSGEHPPLARRVIRIAQQRNIEIRCDVRVTAVDSNAVQIRAGSGNEQRLPAHLTIWATGAAPSPLGAQSSLPLNADGFIRVDHNLRVVGQSDLFAVGDCAVPDAAAWLPRAGVHAVRQGPVLDKNLRALCAHQPLARYRPQKDFLALLNLGDGRAAGGKWRLAAANRPLRRWKDRIDQKFMRRFQVLDPQGQPRSTFPVSRTMQESADQMLCGGCAAKVGPSPLQAALQRLPPAPDDPSVRLGLEHADDAAAVESPRGDLILSSVDAFRAFTDDPWLVGRAAAINATNDLFAKGAQPRHALALVTVPESPPSEQEEILHQTLAGIRSALDPMQVSLVGGHSTTGPELFVGLSVTGEPMRNRRILGIDGLQPGDGLVLTKPLGTGVLLAADMRGLAPSAWMDRATTSMLRDSQGAARLALEFEASACTDISGFGLAGHLLEMADASHVTVRLQAETLPAYPGTFDLIQSGLRSTAYDQNATLRPRVTSSPDVDASTLELMFDPQTSGGLLIGVAAPRIEPLLKALHGQGAPESALIGFAEECRSGPPILRLVCHASS